MWEAYGKKTNHVVGNMCRKREATHPTPFSSGAAAYQARHPQRTENRQRRGNRQAEGHVDVEVVVVEWHVVVELMGGVLLATVAVVEVVVPCRDGLIVGIVVLAVLAVVRALVDLSATLRRLA